MKKAFLLLLILSSCFSLVDFAVARPILTQGQKFKAYDKLFSRVEKQYQDLIKFTDRKLFKKGKSFSRDTWNHWAKRWDEINLMVKTEAKSYSGWDPIVYEYFAVVLRNLTVLAYEYRKFFYAEMATMKDVEAHDQEFHENLNALRFEIDYLKQKAKLATIYSN